MPAIFQLPVAVDIYLEGEDEPTRHLVMVDQREQVLRFPVAAEPKLVIFDAEHMLLAAKDENFTDDQRGVSIPPCAKTAGSIHLDGCSAVLRPS